MFMPRTYRGNHAACIRKGSGRHSQLDATERSLRSLLRVCSTVSVVRRGVSLAGTATSNRPFRSSLTGRGAGVIAILPFSQRTSSGIPGFIPDSRRISLGITNLPAWSMVVFTVRKIPFV